MQPAPEAILRQKRAATVAHDWREQAGQGAGGGDGGDGGDGDNDPERPKRPDSPRRSDRRQPTGKPAEQEGQPPSDATCETRRRPLIKLKGV